MKDRLYASTKVASYFLWEYTKHSNALDLWYCAEDIGFYLEKEHILEPEALRQMRSRPKTDRDYIHLVRHIAFRVHIFTGNPDALANWFAAERLLANGEWIDSVISIAGIYSRIRLGEIEIKDAIRTERIKRHF